MTWRGSGEPEIMHSVSAEHMESVMEGMDLEYTVKNDHAWRIHVDGRRLLLILANDRTDGQLYVGFNDVKASPSQVNLWNMRRRFGRAYADDEGNPVLESDLDFAGGVTDEVLETWMKLYFRQVQGFVRFLHS